MTLSMKNVAYVFALAIPFATYALTYAQTGPNGITGTWQTESVCTRGCDWMVALRADGPNLTGAARSCASNPIEIAEGRIDGNTITFKCNSADGGRTITFTGKVTGDVISFDWRLQVRDGGSPPAPDNGMFGSSAPQRFTAKRVPDSVDTSLAEMANRARKPPNVTFDRILHANQEPQNWLTYSGTVLGHRYSPLTQITPSNVKDLELAWIWQAQSPAWFETTALVVDGILYTVQAPNDVVALNAVTGQLLWTYPYAPKGFSNSQRVNRGLAIQGRTLFIGTLDAHLLAIDAFRASSSGTPMWPTRPILHAKDRAAMQSHMRRW